MASIATSTHLPALGDPHERAGVGHLLDATLRELVDLSLGGERRVGYVAEIGLANELAQIQLTGAWSS